MLRDNREGEGGREEEEDGLINQYWLGWGARRMRALSWRKEGRCPGYAFPNLAQALARLLRVFGEIWACRLPITDACLERHRLTSLDLLYQCTLDG